MVVLAQSLRMVHLLLMECLPPEYLLGSSLSADHLPLVVSAAVTLTTGCLPVERLPLLADPTMKLDVAWSLLLARHLALGPT